MFSDLIIKNATRPARMPMPGHVVTTNIFQPILIDMLFISLRTNTWSCERDGTCLVYVLTVPFRSESLATETLDVQAHVVFQTRPM